MTEHRLSILHISDLHARSLEVDELPEPARERRRGQVHREAASRARVLGAAWADNLRTLYPNGERPDLVCFTGDVADWGLTAEYARATELVDEIVDVLGIARSQVYVVPGNHDVQRYTSVAEWTAMRELLRTDTRATAEWLAGGDPPRAVEAGVADAVMRRTAAFWRWVEHGLGRPELLPARHSHRRLGYHHVPALSQLPFDVHVIGLDSAWLAGDDHDQGKLWLTDRQRDMLLHDERGQPWTGFRLALVHHPLEELAQPDIGPARRGLARTADLLLHGHQHDPVGSNLVDPDGDALRVLAAGCLYEGAEGSEWKNGCQRIDVVLDDVGRPLRAEIWFRAWSSRGHWYSDSSLYRGLSDGRMVWDAWGSRSGVPPDAGSGTIEGNGAADPVTAQLEDAYSRREELTGIGEDTSDVDTEIRDLRRAQRHGPALHAGEFLGDGRFQLIKVIGQGGFATVWKARDRSTNDRPVAVKVLHGQFAHEASRRERLFRGAKRMAELDHPNVVRVLVPQGEEQGFYYYVMEHVEGGDLHQAVLGKRLDHDQALEVIESIASALEAAHERGLVHRDVKPQNILLHPDGRPALTDFDLVQARDTTGGTRTGAMGTVLYAAPEQNENARTVNHRADIYSLGMTAVFCIHGEKLPQAAMFQRDAFLGGLECSREVRDVLRRAVALAPADRFESMASLRTALATARRRSADPPDDEGPRVSRRGLVVGGTAALGAMTVGLGYRYWPDPPQDEGPKIVVGSSGESTGTGDETISAPQGGVELVRIPAGRFLMGSVQDDGRGYDDERPQHEVVLASFYLARTPVTNEQYRRFLEAPDRHPKVEEPKYWGDRRYNQDEQPVVGVSWEDARAYCKWAGLVLPTEAQWEYACRAGTATRYWSGESEEDLARVGWYDRNSGNRLHAVGEKDANDWGLYDMHGNVWEWCEDAFGSYATKPRPKHGLRHEPVGDANRVFRGGGFGFTARVARSASRVGWHPGLRSDDLGFRPAQGHPS